MDYRITAKKPGVSLINMGPDMFWGWLSSAAKKSSVTTNIPYSELFLRHYIFAVFADLPGIERPLYRGGVVI